MQPIEIIFHFEVERDARRMSKGKLLTVSNFYTFKAVINVTKA